MRENQKNAKETVHGVHTGAIVAHEINQKGRNMYRSNIFSTSAQKWLSFVGQTGVVIPAEFIVFSIKQF